MKAIWYVVTFLAALVVFAVGGHYFYTHRDVLVKQFNEVVKFTQNCCEQKKCGCENCKCDLGCGCNKK